MRLIPSKKYSSFIYIASSLFILFFLFSCKKTVDTNADNPNILPDLVTKVTSSVSGFVTDQNNSPVWGATVKVGTVNTTTDQYGYFEVKNVQVVKEAATVSVSFTGYFKGIKTYTAKEGKAAFFRIKLLPKTIAGTIDAATGGNVSQPNGLIISLPANAVKDATTGSAYSGTVNIAAQYIDPASTEINKIMPGDLRAINAGGGMKLLTSYGMMAVELTGAAGELLQIADGKKATITSPIPTSVLSNAPSSILLWHFDEETGFWKEEGTATKTGNTYVGEVSHFSFWNCDVQMNFVHFDCSFSIMNVNARRPLSYAYVKISVVDNVNTYAYGITDSSGFVGGNVPPNANLSLEVYRDYNCTGGALYTQNFSTTNTNISLGDISINTNNSLQSVANITGTVVDCNNNPLPNGNLLIFENNEYLVEPVNSSGVYNFDLLLCTSNPQSIKLRARSVNGLEQSNDTTFSINPGTNNVAAIQVCGAATFDVLSTGYIYHPSISRTLNEYKTLTVLSAYTFQFGVGDLGLSGYQAILVRDPVTNHINITAATGAAGAPYTQFDNGLPASNPGYTPQWPSSALCNNTYDPVNRIFKLRYGYLNASTGWRVFEEFISFL